jgi:site-specific recombinase XerD
MPKIFKPAGKSKYVVFYTDHTGQRRKKTLTGDEKTSERIANALMEKVALRKDGLIDERDERFAEHEAKPIKEHLADYARVVTSKGATAKHVAGMVMKVQRVMDLAKIRRISDLSLSRVQEAIGQVRKDRSTGTVNTYIQRTKSFARWLWRDKRAREYGLDELRQKDAENDRRIVHRRMTDEEVIAVVSAAEHGRTTQGGFTGPDRAMLYRLAHGTGFRAKELRTLTPERFSLDDNPPTVTVLACYSKNGQKATQPIAAALADRLRPWLAGKPRGKCVFERMPNIRTAAMLRRDLAAAGIPYETSEGRATFHASRGTYVSNLVSSGASVKTCQTLARHSDPSLTIGIYAKASLHDISGAVEALPDLAATSPRPESLRATGTDGQSATHSATLDAEQGQADVSNVLSLNGLRDEEAGGISVRGRQYGPCSGRTG